RCLSPALSSPLPGSVSHRHPHSFPTRRSSDLVDPAIVPFLMEKEGMTAEEVMTLLNDRSGLLGISESSSDMRDIEAAWQKGDRQASLAREIFINRVVKYVGAYFAELGGIDALVLAGGIGEHQIGFRLALLV